MDNHEPDHRNSPPLVYLHIGYSGEKNSEVPTEPDEGFGIVRGL